MSYGLCTPLAPNPSWLDAGYGYEDNVTSQNSLTFDKEDCNYPVYETAASTFSEGVPRIIDQALAHDAMVLQMTFDTISPCQSGLATLSTTRSQSRLVLCDHNIALTVGLKEKPTSPVLATTSTATHCLRASLMQHNMWHADAGASTYEQSHVSPSNNSLLSPSAMQSAPKNSTGLVVTHPFLPKRGGQIDLERGHCIIPYDPDAAAPKGQKRKRGPDDQLAATKRNVCRDHTTGRILGEFSTMGSRQKTRAPLNEERRKDTAEARKSGIRCYRCKKLKLRCNLFQVDSPYEPCHRCRNSKPYRNRMPCFRDKITAARFFRLRPAIQSPLETTNRKQVFELSDVSGRSNSLRTLLLTQGIGRGIGQELPVHVDTFTPIEGDKTAYEWRDDKGTQRKMKMPAYCLTDLEIAAGNMCSYAMTSRDLFLDEMLSKSNDITWDTIRMAVRYATTVESSIVGFALRLWSFSRIIEQTWHICGSETLGLKKIDDPTNRWHGIIPVTPIMDTQLDQIVIQNLLVPLSRSLLHQLEDMVENHNRPDTWFEIYLTSFILMTTTESAAIHSKNFSKRYGLPTRYSSHEQMEELFHSAQIILAYFHYACNGSAPLQIDWTKEESAKTAKLDDEEVSYMIRTQARIREKETEVRSLQLKHKYDTHLYWAHQLWFPDWKGSVINIEDEIP